MECVIYSYTNVFKTFVCTLFPTSESNNSNPVDVSKKMICVEYSSRSEGKKDT